jgi:large subunit ribosomal protein L30
VAQLKVQWKKSTIGQKEVHKRTIQALGFRRLHQTRVLEDTPTMRGMLERVKHLVDVSYANGGGEP